MEGFILDCRSQRDPEEDPDNASKSMLDGNNLGATGELQWLKDGLLTSTARWKVVFSSVVINSTTKFPDGWAGYQTEWQALREFIESNRIQNVVLSQAIYILRRSTTVASPAFRKCASQLRTR